MMKPLILQFVSSSGGRYSCPLKILLLIKFVSLSTNYYEPRSVTVTLCFAYSKLLCLI